MNEQVVTVSSAPSHGSHTVPMSLVDLGKRLLDASKRGDTYEIRTLMSSGAPFTTDWLGTSPLHFAAMHGHLDTVTILLRAGISRDARTKVDRTPLHVASQAGHFEIVQVLLKNNAIIDATDMLKMTPLHWAVENGHTNVVNLLLKHDADTQLVDKFDRAPMDIALSNMQMDIVQLLQNANTRHAKALTNQETILEEEVLTTPSNDKPDQQAVIITNEEEHAENYQEAANPESLSTKSDEITKNSSSGNTSVLAALAALAEATASNTSTSTTDTATWLSSRGLSLASDSTTPFTLTEAGKLALTNFIKEQGVQPEAGTLMTLVDEDGNQVVLVQQEPTADNETNDMVISEEGQHVDHGYVHIDTGKVTQEELIEETVD